MRQLAINYDLKDEATKHERVFSRVFILKGEDIPREKYSFPSNVKYVFAEIYTFSFKLIRKNLSKHVVKCFLNTLAPVEFHVYCFIFPFDTLKDLEMELDRFMLREDIKRVCNWVKNETICN